VTSKGYYTPAFDLPLFSNEILTRSLAIFLESVWNHIAFVVINIFRVWSSSVSALVISVFQCNMSHRVWIHSGDLLTQFRIIDLQLSSQIYLSSLIIQLDCILRL